MSTLGGQLARLKFCYDEISLKGIIFVLKIIRVILGYLVWEIIHYYYKWHLNILFIIQSKIQYLLHVIKITLT